jgi:hypothetical protein
VLKTEAQAIPLCSHILAEIQRAPFIASKNRFPLSAGKSDGADVRRIDFPYDRDGLNRLEPNGSNQNMKIKLSVLVSLVLSSLARGASVDVSVDIHLGKIVPPPPPEIIVIEQQAPRPGPPPWAPARGARRNHNYYYYPGTDVYFRPEDRVWFYLEGGNWRFGASLPTNIHVDFGRAVPLEMEADRPYQFHKEVRAAYPGDYFVTKVKVKEKPGKPEGSDDDSPGRGRGRGRGKDK